MRQHDLKAGKIYYFDFGDKSEDIYVGHIVEDDSGQLGPFVRECITNDHQSEYYNEEECKTHDMSGAFDCGEVRLATEKEIRWLEACEKADDYIPSKDIKDIIRLINY